MKRNNPTVYWLIYDGNYAEDHPRLIYYADTDFNGFSPYLLDTGASVLSLWPQGVTVWVHGSEAVDYLKSAYLSIVSDRAKDIISRFDMHGTEFLPVHVRQKKTGSTIGTYWVMHVIKVVDALDWDSTVWTRQEIPDSEKNALSIIKPAFVSSQVRGVHIFHYAIKDETSFGIYISAELKKTLVQERANVCMDFSPVKVVTKA